MTAENRTPLATNEHITIPRARYEALIATEAQAEELHATICIAVTHLNTCPEIAGSEIGHRAHLLLRLALIDYAEAMQERKP